MAAAAELAAFRAMAMHFQIAAWNFSDEQAAEVIAIADGLRDVFLPLATAASSAVPQPHLLQWLQLLPTELLSVILSHLDTHDLARLAATCRPLWHDAPAPPPRPMPLLRPMGLMETELRRRATARGLRIGTSLPEGYLSWVPFLLKRALRDALGRESPLAGGEGFSLFVDAEGRLLTCGREEADEFLLLGHAVDPDAEPNESRGIGPPTLVPSMQERRIVSVAASMWHCLALSCEGEVYSWGDGANGALGHGDEDARAVPSWIESLSRVESIAAGENCTSAAVDEDGRLFTVGRAINYTGSNGLGYALDSQTQSQLTPKWVDALSGDRVVGVALLGVHPGGDRRRRRIFFWVQPVWRTWPRLVGGRGAAPANRSPGANGAPVCRRCCRRRSRPRADRVGRALRVGRCGIHRPRPGQTHSASADRVGRPPCEASVRERRIFMRCDGEGRALYLGAWRSWPTRPRGQGGAGDAKAGGGAERSQGCSGGDLWDTHSWPMRTASCGPSATAWLSASAIRTLTRTRSSSMTYWSPS